jgi:hypothetical protein
MALLAARAARADEPEAVVPVPTTNDAPDPAAPDAPPKPDDTSPITAPPVASAPSPEPAQSSADVTAVRATPARTEPRLHKIAVGVLGGAMRFGLNAQGWAARGVPMDDWSDRGALVVPTFSVGGDGYFMKIELPLARTAAASSYGFGFYPLNYGYFFPTSHLFPYLSAGVVASVLTMPGQGIAGGLGQARAAAGLKASLVRGFGLCAEIGYSPYAVAALVDKQQTHDDIQAGIDGMTVAPTAGSMPSRGGVGRELDVLVGVEWM